MIKNIAKFISLIGIFFSPIALAQVQISAAIPGTNANAANGSPAAFIANFYQFAILIGGVLAVGVIVYAGVKYMASAGNPSGQSDAKEWIWAALIGLLLLFGAYLVLYVIDPGLTQLNLPQLTSTGQITVTNAPPGPSGPNPTGCAGTGCQSISDSGMACKPASQQPNHQASCSAAPGMIATLQCVQSKVGSGFFTVSEAMPPTVAHESSCHQNGCCVDVNVNSASCANVQKVMDAVSACGATAANEYAGCAGSKIYGTTTGGNVHINSTHTGGC